MSVSSSWRMSGDFYLQPMNPTMSNDDQDSDFSDDEPSTAEPVALAPDRVRDLLPRSYAVSRFNSDRGEDFLPASFVERLLPDEDTITREIGQKNLETIPSHKSQRLVEWIQDEAPRLFLILIQMNLGEDLLFKSMKAFKRKKLTDSDLPLDHPTCDSTSCPKGQCTIFPLREQGAWYRRAFGITQWIFLSPVFKRDKSDYDCHHKAILPFIQKGIENASTGGFSTVYKVTIHADHSDYADNEVAVKEINLVNTQSEKTDEQTNKTDELWDFEANALNMVKSMHHPHLVECLAAIRQGPKRLFMFPWASGGNLTNFWADNSGHALTNNWLRHSLEQLRGLADALDRLHNYAPTGYETDDSGITISNPEGTPMIMRVDVGPEEQDVIIKTNDETGEHSIRHGDLKPDNILVYLDSKDGSNLGTLKIGDMGLAKRHVVATQLRDKVTSTRYGTALYEAPGGKLKARSRLYDIWSMGCIVLEYIIWLLYGNEAVLQLHEQLSESPNNQFFEIVDGQSGKTEVHRVVRQWITYMETNNRECRKDSAIGDLLNLVKSKLLVVELSEKAKSGRRERTLPAMPLFNSSSVASGESFRGTSQDFLDEIDMILSRLTDAKTGEVYGVLNTGQEGVVTLPLNFSHHFRNPSSATHLGISQENGGGPRSGMPMRPKGANNDYALPPLKEWEYLVKNEFAMEVVKRLGAETLLPRSPGEPELCAQCRRLDFWRGGFSIELLVADLERRSSECSLCAMLVHTAAPVLPAQSIRFMRHNSILGLQAADRTLPVISLIRSPELKTPPDIQIGFAELLKPGTSEFYDLLRLWLQDCDKHKGCEARKRPVLPTRLIDIGTGDDFSSTRLVETECVKLTDEKYIALSHPWGDPKDHPPFSTLRRDPNGKGRDLASLKSRIPFEELPATFQDAIWVTHALGVRYLWIDSLCIIQGEDGDFSEESTRMEDVFSCAYCVIAASRATGQHGGFLQPLESREFLTIKKNPNDEPFYICEGIDDFHHHVLEGSLNMRGWILQERALARRTIFFTSKQTYFECGEGVCCQTLFKLQNKLADFLGDPNFPEKAINIQRGLKIAYFQELYKRYTRLNFSHIEDRPFAIAGLENRLRTAYRTDGAFGIFDDGEGQGLFHRSLLWQRGQEKFDDPWLTRITFPPGRQIDVPTWSWMAYKGGIDYIEPTFDGTDWETEDVHPPRIKDHTSSQGAGNKTKMELVAKARPFDVSGRSRQDTVNLVYDQEIHGRASCVVVAKSKGDQIREDKTYYVLLVAPVGSNSGSGTQVYERVGVGSMRGKFIQFDQPSLPVRIR
ncbi:hypothetical protein GGR57DRAFT_425286 [Xylariaceae sp. FL1272]|nr:hypothetical protein GGR57DRAFT_425286 [Xylariaceae sp. FL1272]